MAAPTTIDEAVSQALLEPKSVTEGDRTIVNRDLNDLQDARDRERGATAGKKPHFGLRFTKLLPPGCQ